MSDNKTLLEKANEYWEKNSEWNFIGRGRDLQRIEYISKQDFISFIESQSPSPVNEQVSAADVLEEHLKAEREAHSNIQMWDRKTIIAAMHSYHSLLSSKEGGESNTVKDTVDLLENSDQYGTGKREVVLGFKVMGNKKYILYDDGSWELKQTN